MVHAWWMAPSLSAEDGGSPNRAQRAVWMHRAGWASSSLQLQQEHVPDVLEGVVRSTPILSESSPTEPAEPASGAHQAQKHEHAGRVCLQGAYRPAPCAGVSERASAAAGYNRTGFVVCSYLVERAGLSVGAALDAFAHARPGGVHHDDFVVELHRRYGHVAAPIATYDATEYACFYSCSATAAEARLHALWHSAGCLPGSWMTQNGSSSGEGVREGGLHRGSRMNASVRSVMTTDSHNDLEGLLDDSCPEERAGEETQAQVLEHTGCRDGGCQ